jgi:hypothetical protein
MPAWQLRTLTVVVAPACARKKRSASSLAPAQRVALVDLLVGQIHASPLARGPDRAGLYGARARSIFRPHDTRKSIEAVPAALQVCSGPS